MAFEIEWDDAAIDDFKNILQYLKEEWSENSVIKFEKVLEKKLFSISINPNSGEKTFRNSRIRKIVVTYQNTLYYQFNHDAIKILRIFDTRQHPRKLKLHKR